MENKKRKLMLGLFICLALNIILFAYVFSLKKNKIDTNIIIKTIDSYSFTDSSVPGYPLEFNFNKTINNININVKDGEILKWNGAEVSNIGSNYEFKKSETLYFDINTGTVITVSIDFTNNSTDTYEITFNIDNNNYDSKIKKVN